MKKLLAVLLLTAIGTANADGFRHGGHHGHHGGYPPNNWVAPFVIGSIVTYALTRPPVVVAEPPQVIYVPTGPAPVSYSATPPFGYHWEQVLDANCNCYRVVAVPN